MAALAGAAIIPAVEPDGPEFHLALYRLPRGSLPELCYFDPGDISSYFARPSGGFEIVAQEKYSDEEIGRVPASVAGGHAVTLVLTGGGQQPFGVLTFPDF